MREGSSPRPPTGGGRPTNPNPPMEAILVLDTKQHERVGARSLGLVDRRLLYRAPTALVELRLPPPQGPDEEAWVFGQYLSAKGTAVPRRIRVTLRDDAGGMREAEASEMGDFALPCDPTRPFSLECRTAAGLLVTMRYEP
jgi:hypothetical protein